VNELINEAIEVVNEHEFCKEMALNSIVADLKEESKDERNRPQALASFVPILLFKVYQTLNSRPLTLNLSLVQTQYFIQTLYHTSQTCL